MGSSPERETTDDHELVLRTKRGDRSAFEILVSRYQDRAYNVAYQILRHHEDALDVAQEAFARAYVSIGRFQGKAGFYTWLYRILVNLAIDQTRARGRQNPVPRDDPEREVALREMTADPADSLETKELREQIVKAVARLPADQRAALTLREIDGLSYQEIARIMKCSIGTVMSRLYAARQKLQQLLGYYAKTQ
ncbi:MAG TPA: sigma-70 family RNA polymerase sigma factor [Candidatus Methylomirabilis sp.]|nr:sigma-70 family RNA polymerase sigma factor [Candidatus Methylomirabilis sp.]